MVHITASLSPVGPPTSWARIGGEGPPPRPPCLRWILCRGPQISAQPFVMTDQSLLPAELSAVGLISSPCRAGAGAPGLSWGGSWARPGGLPQARPHSWPPLARPRQPKGRTPEVQPHPCRPPALSLGNAGMKDPRPPTGAAGWAPVCFLLRGPGCCWLQEERDAWWVLWPRPQQPRRGWHSPGIQMQALKAQKTGLWDRGGIHLGDGSQMVWPEWAVRPLSGAAAVSVTQESLWCWLGLGPPHSGSMSHRDP